MRQQTEGGSPELAKGQEPAESREQGQPPTAFRLVAPEEEVIPTRSLESSRVSSTPLLGRLQSPYVVTGVVGLFYLVLLAWLWNHFHGDPLGFVHQGTVFSQGDPAGTRGYDGQFYYYTAIDPWNAASHMDNATFRLQRIFFPLLIIVVSLGQHALVPYAMILINYLSVLGGTLLVGLLLARWGRSPWFALGYSLCTGIPVALTFDTAEPLAFALAALGIYLWDRADPRINRPSFFQGSQKEGEGQEANSRSHRRLLVAGALAFAAALLTRELALYFVAGYAVVAAYVLGKDFFLRLVGDRSHRQPPGGAGGRIAAFWRERAMGALKLESGTLLLSVAAFLPVTLWSAYLSLSSHYLGVSFAQPFEHIPFLAYLLQLGAPSKRSLGYAAQYIVPTAIFGALALWQLIRTWRWPPPLTIALLGNVHLLMFLPRLGYQHQVASSRYLLGLALAAVLWAGASKPRWLLWLTLIFALTFLAYLYGLVHQDPAYLW